ncbi:MAG: hypothetical protein A2144_14795 [Chloroflexi bacterium RBG_16_50_9]|nr:MAG: hypothetical protein A2144_14795 [Chloroflexi bacterium RBG_16_50_9]
MKKLEGTAMTELVGGGKLKRADILLAHSKGSYWGWLIRLGTRCYWNHALILDMVRGPNQGYDKALIIDPRMGSIHIGNITHYFENSNRYDVAVKRLDKEWFQNDSEVSGLSYYNAVCEIALRETTDKFDTRLVKVGRGILRQVRLTYRFVRRRIKYPRPGKKRLSSITKRLKISAYGCGGFVQWSYHQGVSQILEKTHDENKLKDAIFNPRLVEPVTQHDLLSTTPADLARSDKLSWEYVVKDGEVWEVSSEDEVSSILKSGKRLK